MQPDGLLSNKLPRDQVIGYWLSFTQQLIPGETTYIYERIFEKLYYISNHFPYTLARVWIESGQHTYMTIHSQVKLAYFDLSHIDGLKGDHLMEYINFERKNCLGNPANKMHTLPRFIHIKLNKDVKIENNFHGLIRKTGQLIDARQMMTGKLGNDSYYKYERSHIIKEVGHFVMLEMTLDRSRGASILSQIGLGVAATGNGIVKLGTVVVNTFQQLVE